MGLRFRKSVKVAPGVKFNLGKKSAGISLGGKYGGVSFNSSSGARSRISAPGTGLSYSAKIGDSSNNKSSKSSRVSAASGNSNGGGCLITCLKIFGIFLFLPLIVCFGWILGIIWLVFLRKKLNDEPEKQKKYTIAVSILSVISLLLMISGFNPSSDSPDNPSLNDVTANTEIISSSEIEQVLNSEDTYSDGLNTQILETEFSNYETETQTESDSLSDVDSTLKSEDSSESDSSSSITPAPTDQNESAQESEAPVQEQKSSQMVWINDTATKYHRKSDCSGMLNARQVTEEEALSLGKTACKRCY